MTPVENFWKWFETNNEQLTMLADLDEREQQQLLEQLQDQLTHYREGITYEMGEPTPTGRTLTFSAEGDFALFRYVDELVENAPDLDWWDFIAYRQPKGKDLKVTFDKYHFKVNTVNYKMLQITHINYI